MGILAVYNGYLPVYFKGYGIFDTPLPSINASLVSVSICYYNLFMKAAKSLVRLLIFTDTHGQ